MRTSGSSSRRLRQWRDFLELPLKVCEGVRGDGDNGYSLSLLRRARAQARAEYGKKVFVKEKLSWVR